MSFPFVIRQKTTRTTKGNPTTITIPWNNFINRILNERTIKSSNANNYIFGMIHKCDSIEIRRKIIKQFMDVTMIG